MRSTCSNVGSMSAMIQIRNVPEDLHRRLKARAAMAGMSLSDYLLKEISAVAERPTMEEMRERLATRSRVETGESAAECNPGHAWPVAVIVADASALVDVLLRRPTADAIEARLFGSGLALHVPHLLDVEVAHVVRRHAAGGEIVPERGHELLTDLVDLPCSATRTIGCCRACGSCGTTSPPTTPSMSPSPRRSTRRSSPATSASPPHPATARVEVM